jgi:hypothetical protein
LKIARYIVDIEVPDDVMLSDEKIDAALSVIPASLALLSQDIVTRCVWVGVPAKASWRPIWPEQAGEGIAQAGW